MRSWPSLLPTRTLSALLADPQLGPWVQRRGSLAAVQAYVRTFPLPPKQRAMLEAFLERPGDTMAAYIERLDIPETTIQRYLKALLAALTDHLSTKNAASRPGGYRRALRLHNGPTGR